VCQEPVIWSRTQVALGVLPYLVLAAVVVIDLIVGHGIGLLALLSLGPAFAAVVGGLTRMIIVSCLALALCLFLAAYQDRLFDVDDQVALVTVLGVSVAGVIASTLRQRQERELADVRIVAEAAQQVLLRPVPAESGAVRIAVRYISATSRATIGGDLYEVIAAPDATRFIIGDVQGKGLAAVKLASTVLGAFHLAFCADRPTVTAITIANAIVFMAPAPSSAALKRVRPRETAPSNNEHTVIEAAGEVLKRSLNSY